MFFKLQPIVYSLIFVLILEISIFREDFIFKIAVFLFVFSLIIIWPLAGRLRFLAIPLLLSIGSLSLLYLIDNRTEKQLFIFLSFLVYYVALLGAYRLKLYRYDSTAQGMINMATLVASFFWFASIVSWFLNFNISDWVLIITFFISTFFLSLPSFSISADLKKEEKDFFAKNNFPEIHRGTVFFLLLIFSVIMAEWTWGIIFWPFGYLTTAVISLIIFYIFWDAIRCYLKNDFNIKRFFSNVFISFLLVIILLVTTEWNLII